MMYQPKQEDAIVLCTSPHPCRGCGHTSAICDTNNQGCHNCKKDKPAEMIGKTPAPGSNPPMIAPQRSEQIDQQKMVQDMRYTLGSHFASAGLVMAAKNVWSTQAEIADIEGANKQSESDLPSNSFFFQEVYTPFMEVLIKGNSSVSKINDHARTVSASERCFFCLLIMVTFIYAIGILTAIVLLSSMMWFTYEYS